MNHFYKDVGGWFKFRSAFDRILDGLPSDRPSTFVEIGLWLGRSTAYLGVEILNRRKPVSIIAIDHFNGQPEIIGWRRELIADSEASFRKNIAPVATALNGRFHLVVADSVSSAETVQDDSVEAVWIDADHSYACVRDDIAAWWPKLRVGGFIGGDDFAKCVGVRQAVNERFGAEIVHANHYWLAKRLPGDAVEFLS